MSLSKQQLLEVWEYGRNQHPVDQALTLLSFTSPDQTRNELAELSIGQRDIRLLALHERIFGEKISCDGDCPDCKQAVDISFTTKEIQTPSTVQGQQETELKWDDFKITYRLPNSWDLAVIANSIDEESARQLLIERCLVKINRKGISIAASELSEQAILKTEQAIAKSDPQAEILLDMNCPECDTEWQLLFDIVTFLWTEITVKAKRLLEEIHTLAKTYGWTETNILELSDVRRHIYLEMASS